MRYIQPVGGFSLYALKFANGLLYIFICTVRTNSILRRPSCCDIIFKQIGFGIALSYYS